MTKFTKCLVTMAIACGSLALAGHADAQVRKKKRVKHSSSSQTVVAPPSNSSSSSSAFALGVSAGWEAPYGNAITASLYPSEMFELQAGIGYNLSGVKVGIGSNILLGLSPDFGFQGGAAFVYSTGQKREVSLDAKFQPEGSQSEEALVATKSYELSGATLVNASVGGYFFVTRSIKLIGTVGYNVVVGGNEVTFDDEIRYDKRVDVTNRSEFDERFQERAKDLVAAGGLGFSIGAQLML